MKIEGQKYLFGNYFEKMTVEEKKDGIVCRVKPSISGKLLTGKNISGNFKENFNNSRDDYEKVLKLIEYFLRYNQVTMLKQNSYDYRVNGRKSIEIIGNRNLVLSVNSNPYEQQMLNLIKNKTLYDLESTLFDTLDKENVVSITLYKGECSKIDVWNRTYLDADNFEFVEVPEEKCITVYYPEFMKQNIQKIVNKVINNLLEQNKVHCSYYISEYMHAKIGNLRLNLHPDMINDEIRNVIHKHNWGLLESNQKQMKLKYGKRR